MQILRRFLRPDAPVAPAVSVQQLFPDHISTKGAEIIIEISDDDICFTLGIDAVKLKRLRDYLQNDALLLALGRNGLQPAVFEEGIDYLLAILGVPLRLNLGFVGLRCSISGMLVSKISFLSEYIM